MVRFYDHKTGKVLASWDAGLGELSAVAFSPDGSRLAVVSNQGNGAKIWDIATRKELLTLESVSTNDVAFTPDGKRLVFGEAINIRLIALTLDELSQIAHSRLTRSLTTEECPATP